MKKTILYPTLTLVALSVLNFGCRKKNEDQNTGSTSPVVIQELGNIQVSSDPNLAITSYAFDLDADSTDDFKVWGYTTANSCGTSHYLLISPLSNSDSISAIWPNEPLNPPGTPIKYPPHGWITNLYVYVLNIEEPSCIPHGASVDNGTGYICLLHIKNNRKHYGWLKARNTGSVIELLQTGFCLYPDMNIITP